MNFRDQYNHPKWQRKRLECLEAAEYQCQMCYDGESQLQVHHKRYVKNRKVWEYEVDELEVLCDACHQQAQAEKDIIQEVLTKFPCEAVPEITALIAGYSSTAFGPAGGLMEGKEFLEKLILVNPFTFYVGAVAGSIPNCTTIETLQSFIKVLNENRYRERKISFSFPKPKGFLK